MLQDGPVPRLRTAKPKVGVAILRGGCCPRNTFNLVSPVPASVIESKPFHAFVSQPPRAQYALWGALLQTQTKVFARVSLCGARPVNPGSGGGGYSRWEQALAALLRALSVPDMPMQVQLERSIEAAVLCEGMGLKVNTFFVLFYLF